MKSNSTGRRMERARSLMNMNAPFRTPTRRGGRPWKSRVISLPSSATRRRRVTASTTTAPRESSWGSSTRRSRERLRESAPAIAPTLMAVRPPGA